MNLQFKKAPVNLRHEAPVDSHCDIKAELGKIYTGANNAYFEYIISSKKIKLELLLTWDGVECLLMVLL